MMVLSPLSRPFPFLLRSFDVFALFLSLIVSAPLSSFSVTTVFMVNLIARLCHPLLNYTFYQYQFDSYFFRIHSLNIDSIIVSESAGEHTYNIRPKFLIGSSHKGRIFWQLKVL